MVRVNGPMFSLDARGKLGNAIVFSARKGTSVVRSFVKQKKSNSDNQNTVRSVFTTGSSSWRFGEIEDPQKTLWNTYASGTTETGFNRFMRFYLAANYDKVTKQKENPPVIPLAQ